MIAASRSGRPLARFPLTVFFVLAFLLPWLVWGTQIAEEQGWLGWHIPSALAFWIGLPLAAYGTAALTGGWPAVRDLLLRLFRWRVNGWWYALALLATPLLAGIAILVGALAGEGAHPDLGGGALGIAGLFLFNAWMWLLTEETAWRGFALPRLQQRMRPVTASALLGVIWACWHLPLWAIGGSFQSQLPFFGFLLSTVATSVLIGLVFNGARGSVLLAALVHAAADVTIATTAVMTSGGVLFWIFVIAQLIAAALCAPLLARYGQTVLSTGSKETLAGA